MTSKNENFINAIYQKCLAYNASLVKNRFYILGDDVAQDSFSEALSFFRECVEKRIANTSGLSLPKLEPTDNELVGFIAFYMLGAYKYFRDCYIDFRVEKTSRGEAFCIIAGTSKQIVAYYTIFQDSRGPILSRVLVRNDLGRLANKFEKALCKVERRGL